MCFFYPHNHNLSPYGFHNHTTVFQIMSLTIHNCIYVQLDRNSEKSLYGEKKSHQHSAPFSAALLQLHSHLSISIAQFAKDYYRSAEHESIAWRSPRGSRVFPLRRPRSATVTLVSLWTLALISDAVEYSLNFACWVLMSLFLPCFLFPLF